MTNSRQKGRRTLAKAKQHYEEEGWLVDEVELGGKFRKSRDLFSSEDFSGFDLVGLRQGKVILIQVKTNTPPNLTEYGCFARKYGGNAVLIESCTWYDRRGWVFHKFSSKGVVTRIDLRK